MFNWYIQGFIESVTHLVKVKSEAHKLKNKIIDADRVIQESGREVNLIESLLLLCVLLPAGKTFERTSNFTFYSEKHCI